jgi:glucose/arabinose dehydrogenase
MTVAPLRMLLRVLLLALLLAGCGGGGGSGGSGSGASAGSGSGATQPPPAAGSLVLTVTGLPAGIAANIAVTGPASYNRMLTQGATLADLVPGIYTIAASPAGGATPAPATQTVTVTANTAASAAVAYSATPAPTLQLVAGGLAAPTFAGSPPGDPRLFVTERAGRIRIIQNGAPLAAPFLDLSARTTTDGERGLLSMAFDPQFAANGHVYVYYTDRDGSIALERYTTQGGNTADPASALRILTIPHPDFSNHNGGLLAFGPDGMLYAGIGDGGSAGDPRGNAQNRGVLLGKLLRLDVGAASTAVPYRIPPSNPFVGTAGARPEIWAVGLRNPWRFAFDALDGLLYIADVGQGLLEEVDVSPLAAAGLNYGWNTMEGSSCYNVAQCDRQGLTLPVLEYGHTGGQCSITGGYVYRGRALPELAGHYFYADLCTGGVHSFRYAGGVATVRTDWNFGNIGQVYSFGLDGNGELLVVSAAGSIYRLARP